MTLACDQSYDNAVLMTSLQLPQWWRKCQKQEYQKALPRTTVSYRGAFLWSTSLLSKVLKIELVTTPCCTLLCLSTWRVHSLMKFLLSQFRFLSFLSLSLQTRMGKNNKKQQGFSILNCPMKSEGVTTQMKALHEYFLMVVFTLFLNTVHVFANLCFIYLNRINMAVEGLLTILKNKVIRLWVRNYKWRVSLTSGTLQVLELTSRGWHWTVVWKKQRQSTLTWISNNCNL